MQIKAIDFLQKNPKQKKQFKQNASINTEVHKILSSTTASRTHMSIKFWKNLPFIIFCKPEAGLIHLGMYHILIHLIVIDYRL